MQHFGCVFALFFSDNHYYEKFEDGTVNDITNEIPFEIPDSWKWCKFSLLNYTVGSRNNQIKSIEILKEGKFPVVSQGQNLIDGYFNDKNKLFKLEHPLIMFGDHTKNVKYIDFDFIIGADGTKFISNIKFHEKYLYYFILYSTINMRNRGYARHFTLLNNCYMPLPPLEEQNRIISKIEKLLPYIEKYNIYFSKLEDLNKNYKQELKKSILQYAIQGKLVKQNPNDEPAEVLINKILDEKRELIKTKQIKKEKLSVIYKDTTDNQFYEKFDDGTIKNITDDIPFDIPDNWCWTRINNIVKSINAGGDKPKIFSKNITKKNTIPVISNGEKNEGIFGFTDKPVIFEKSLTISGRGTIGYSKIRTIPYVPIVRLLVLIPLTNTNLEYLQLSIQALIERGVGSAIKQLTVPMIKHKLIPIPPLSEQMKILNIFNQFIQIIEK